MIRRTFVGCCLLAFSLPITTDRAAEPETKSAMIGTASIAVSVEQYEKIDETEQRYRDEIATQRQRWNDQLVETREEQRQLHRLNDNLRAALISILTPEQQRDLRTKETAELRDQAARDVQFLSAISSYITSFLQAERIVCYEGFPRGLSNAELTEQRRKRKTTTFEGFEFYDEPQEIAPDDLGKSQKILGDYRSFRPYGGPKFCGGYHPDWCLEWTVERRSYRVYICFGCHEAKFVSGDRSMTLMVDLEDDAYEVLRELVTDYLIHRPIPNKL